MTVKNSTCTTPHSSPLAPDASAGVFCLDVSYSTTRLVTREMPVIEDQPDAKFKSMLFLPPNPDRNGEGGLRTKGYFKKSLRDKPLITVITVVFNGENHLEDTIKSVINQTYDNVEYIIIDGGSTDCTVDIIKKYDGQIDYWVSEKDSGIYDAMNKGIRLACGTFIHHLNIGDKLLTIPVRELFKVKPDVFCVAGQVQTIRGKMHKPSFGLGLKLHNTLHHQGCFYIKGPHLRYDTSYQVFSDFDLNQRLFRKGFRVLTCSDVVSVHDVGGVSHDKYRFKELYRIICRNEGPFWVVLSFLYFKLQGLLSRLER